MIGLPRLPRLLRGAGELGERGSRPDRVVGIDLSFFAKLVSLIQNSGVVIPTNYEQLVDLRAREFHTILFNTHILRAFVVDRPDHDFASTCIISDLNATKSA